MALSVINPHHLLEIPSSLTTTDCPKVAISVGQESAGLQINTVQILYIRGPSLAHSVSFTITTTSAEIQLTFSGLTMASGKPMHHKIELNRFFRKESERLILGPILKTMSNKRCCANNRRLKTEKS